MRVADRGPRDLGRDARRRAVGLPDHVQKRDLADRRGDLRVGGRRGQRIASAHRRPERHDAPRVDALGLPGVGDRAAPVLELARGHEAIGLAPAVAEATMVEHQGVQPASGEALGERPQAIAPRPRQAMRHHHDRPTAGDARFRGITYNIPTPVVWRCVTSSSRRPGSARGSVRTSAFRGSNVVPTRPKATPRNHRNFSQIAAKSPNRTAVRTMLEGSSRDGARTGADGPVVVGRRSRPTGGIGA
jgi:hypothetical protein